MTKIVLHPRAPAAANQANPPDNLADRGSAGWKHLCWLALVGCATALLCAPFLRAIYAVSDEGILLYGADRILQAERLYVDFFAILPPGGFAIVAAWFGIAGISMLSARILAILVIVGIACFTYRTCRRVSGNAPGSALLVLGWVVMSQGAGTQVSHHWFATLFVIICAWASITSTSHSQRWLLWPLIAGAAAGAACMVTPTQGALAVVAAATAFLNGPRYKAKLGIFLLATALVPAGLLLYVIWLGALTAGFHDVIVFNATRYAGIQAVPFAWGASRQNAPLGYLFPFAALLILLSLVRDWRTALHDRIFRSSIAFGLAALLGCFPRPDMFHIAAAVPVACPLVAYCMHRLTRGWIPMYRYVAVAVLIGACIPAARAFSWVVQNALHGKIVPTPRGNVAFFVNGAQELVTRIDSTPAGAAYFFYPTEELLPFLTARQQVGRFDRLMPNYNTPVQYQDACVAVMRRAEWIAVANTDSAGWTAMYPAMRDPAPRERMQFEHVLDDASEPVARDGWFELRRRVQGIDEGACAGIAK